MNGSLGPLTIFPSTTGETPTTGAGDIASAFAIPGTARIGRIETTGFDGPTTIARAVAMASSAAGVAAAYDGLLDGMVADEAVDGLPHLVCDTLMTDAAARRRLAEETLRFAESLR